MFSRLVSRTTRLSANASPIAKVSLNRAYSSETYDNDFVAYHPRSVWDGPGCNLTPESAAALKDYVARQKQMQGPLLEQYPELTNILARENNIFAHATADQGEPIRVAVSGAAGQIGYALLYRIACGDVFGAHVPVQLQLLELPQAQNALKGVEMELLDCAFPTLAGVVCTDDPNVAFEGVDYALLVGGQPRTKGMERADLLLKNAAVFSAQGKALNQSAKGKDTRVLIVGNPANTNAMIASRHAPKIPAKNFSAMTRLDHNRGLAQLVDNIGCGVSDIKQFAIWGNHSPTQFPNVAHASVNGKPVSEIIDQKWYETEFTPVVQQRGGAVIAARGASSAASAASSLVDGVKDWHLGTFGNWTSAAVVSEGDYGIEKGLFFSYPVTFANGEWTVVKDLDVSDEYSQKMINKTHDELKTERDAVAAHLP